MKISIAPTYLDDKVSLRPYIEEEAIANAKADALIFDTFVTDDIKQFIPGLPVFTGTPSENYFSTLPLKMAYGAGVVLAIRYVAGLAGLIILDTPLYNRGALGLEVWSIDFFILQPFRGHKLIMKALYHTLKMCKYQMGIDKIYASVDKRNTKCMHIIEKFYFQHIQDDPTGKGALYELNLETLNFE
jgi:RimJ/RimL family protein N-acetyltransferase